MTNNIEEVLHIVAPHGRLPDTLCGAYVKLALVRISLKFLGYQKAMRGGSENAFIVVLKCEGSKHVAWWLIQEIVELDRT